jgi:DNA-binding SARP family transcriptional activator
MPPLQLFTLGGLRLLDAGEDVLPGRRKDLALLVYLVQHSPRAVPRADLATLLWEQRDEGRARQSLRQALRDLRSALGDRIDISARFVRVAQEAVMLDSVLFEADLAAGRIETAVARWHGDFLPAAEDLGGEAFRAWLEGERIRLRRRFAAALEQLVSGAEQRGEWGMAVEWARRWVDAEPFNEHAHIRLIEMLRLAGQPEEAAAVHTAFATRLWHELNVEPSAEFLRLEAALRPGPGIKSARPADPRSSALFSPDMVGRGAAFGQLLAVWHDVRAAGGAVVVVEGEEGIGKTRLCEEFLRWVAEAGDETLVLRSRAYVAERESAWTAARDLLAPLGAAPGLGGAPDDALAELSRVVPSIRDRFPRLPTAHGGEQRILDAVHRVLSDISTEVPIVVFLDDFHTADEATRQMLLSLARRPPPRLFLLLTARSDEADADAALSPLREIPGLHRLPLHTLAPAEVEALLESMLVLEPAQRHNLALRLHRQGEGNPFYTIAFVSAMADAGHLIPGDSGVWRIVPDTEGTALPLPVSIRDAVRARLEHLREDASEVAGAAAVLGRTIDSVLLEVVAGLPDTAFCAAIEELIARRLLRVAPPPARGYEFTHDLIRRVTYELLTPTRRQHLHRTALTALRRGSHGAPAAGAALERHRVNARIIRRPPQVVRRIAPFAAAMVIALAAATGLMYSLQPSSESLVIAVGQIDDFSGADSVARVLPDLLATNLSRVPALRVVSSARMHELLARERDRAAAPAAFASAARYGGATHLIEGALYRQPDGTLRLDLRRVDLDRGAVHGSYTVAGADPFSLVDKVTARVLADLRLPSRDLSVADATTRSLVAYRFYQEGLRAYYHGDDRGAKRLFDAALAEDSSFAMAAYYAGRSIHAADFSAYARYLAHARDLAEHVSEPERLLIHGTWAYEANEPSRAAIAETLAIRYPGNPDGPLLLVRALIGSGDFLRSIPYLQRVIAMESSSVAEEQPRCRACDAYQAVVNAYTLADSLPAAERAARKWVRRTPNSATAMHALGGVLQRRECDEEALQVRLRAVSLQQGSAPFPSSVFSADCAMRKGQFGLADRLLRADADAGARAVQREALWFLIISLRYQGRMQEALAGGAGVGGASWEQGLRGSSEGSSNDNPEQKGS